MNIVQGFNEIHKDNDKIIYIVIIRKNDEPTRYLDFIEPFNSLEIKTEKNVTSNGDYVFNIYDDTSLNETFDAEKSLSVSEKRNDINNPINEYGLSFYNDNKKKIAFFVKNVKEDYKLIITVK